MGSIIVSAPPWTELCPRMNRPVLGRPTSGPRVEHHGARHLGGILGDSHAQETALRAHNSSANSSIAAAA